MHKRNSSSNNAPGAIHCKSRTASVELGKLTLTAAVFAVALGACGKTEKPISTAERVKIVDEKQRTDLNFHLEKKAGGTSIPAPAPAAPAAPVTVQADPSKSSAKM